MSKNTPFLPGLKTISISNSTCPPLGFLSGLRKIWRCNHYYAAFYLLSAIASQSWADNTTSPETGDLDHSYYVVVGTANKSVGHSGTPKPTRCVFDKRTALTWEIKTSDNGIQSASQTYSWFEPNSRINGGFSGHRNKGQCNLQLCDTAAYVAQINSMKLCGFSDWRLPSREELRTLVEYNITYPGPTINKIFFPYTLSQFYWSATPSANDRETAWGIGFSFGYDYAYFKSDHGYIRLVRGPDNE